MYFFSDQTAKIQKKSAILGRIYILFASKAKIVDFSKKIQNLFVDFALFEVSKCIIFSILEHYAITH